MWDVYLPLWIQETPYQQQFVWQTTLSHIFPALEHSPVQDDACHEFHGFSSDNPASHHTPSTPWSSLDELKCKCMRAWSRITIYSQLTFWGILYFLRHFKDIWHANNYFTGHRVQWSRSGTLACQCVVVLGTVQFIFSVHFICLPKL